MIFPEDYKVVGISRDFRPSDPIYFSTRYVLCCEGDLKTFGDVSLYEVESHGEGFMRSVGTTRLVSSNDQIVVYPKCVNTRDRAELITLAYDLCKGSVDTVVFIGPDEHVTFVHGPDPSVILEIEVLDVSPPDPPWLVYVIDGLSKNGLFGDLTIRFKSKVVDLRDYEGPNVYFPCKASGLGRSLDADRISTPDPVVVGCEVSRAIFQATSSFKAHRFINICPVSGDLIRPTGPFITRCCRSERRGITVKNGHKGIVVHWGDGPNEIASAVRTLAGILSNEIRQ